MTQPFMKPQPGLFSDLIDKHVGQTAFILGGGPSLVEAHKKIADTKKPHIKISVNSHGCRLTKCDYVVYLDYKQVSEQLNGMGDKTPRISWDGTCDYRMINHWHASNSSKVAVWVAWQMGCYPIVLLGMDCYGGNATYWHDADAISSGAATPVRNHVSDWDRDTRTVIPLVRPALRALDNPLENVFGRYNPAEEIEPPEKDRGVTKEIRKIEASGVAIEFLVGMKHKHEMYVPGEVALVDKHFANWAVIRGRAKYYEEPIEKLMPEKQASGRKAKSGESGDDEAA